jgi:hypothetical protein
MASILNLKKLCSLASGLFCIGVVIAASGCSTLHLGADKAAVAPVVSPDSRGAFLVEMSGGFSKASMYKGDLDGPITVQTALERSGAIEKFRSMEVSLFRVVEETGHPLRLSVPYSPRKKSVLPEHDYALHPNDRIIVASKTNNALDKLVDSLNPGEKY